MKSKPQLDIRAAECLADSEKLFVLWALEHGLGRNKAEFTRHYGDAFHYTEICEQLLNDGLLYRRAGQFALSQLGKDVIGILKGPPLHKGTTPGDRRGNITYIEPIISDNVLNRNIASPRPGFRIMEILVVTAACIMLVGVLVPSVQNAREAARRMQCKNNLKQIGLAIHSYESTFTSFPPSMTSPAGNGVWQYRGDAEDQFNPDMHLHSFCGMILPYLDQSQLYPNIDFSRSSLAQANRPLAKAMLPVFLCPSNLWTYSTDPIYVDAPRSCNACAIRNYAAMGSTTPLGLIGRIPSNGVMYPQSTTKSIDIVDGLSSTILLAETRERNASVWIDGSCAALSSRPLGIAPSYTLERSSLNYPTIPTSTESYFDGNVFGMITQKYGPSSLHSGGVQHVMTDGSVRFISETIDYRVYDALVTRAGMDTGDDISSPIPVGFGK